MDYELAVVVWRDIVMKLLEFTASHGIGSMSSATVNVIEQVGDNIAIGDLITLTVTRDAFAPDVIFVGRIAGFTLDSTKAISLPLPESRLTPS